MNSKTLKKYISLLPNQITVAVKKTKLGFVADIKDFPHCYTQGRNFAELVEMINDAVFTYLDILEKYRGSLGVYLPDKIVNEIKRIKLQEAFRDLIKQPMAIKSTFTRIAPVAV